MFDAIALMLSELDFITTHITAIVMILTLISLLLANLTRYLQAKKYGIPLKMIHQASIPDSLDIWVTLVVVLGLGIVLPFAIIYVRIPGIAVFFIVLMSVFLIMLYVGTKFGRTKHDKAGNIVKNIDYSNHFYAVVAVLAACATTFLHHDAHLNVSVDTQSGVMSFLIIFARILRGVALIPIVGGLGRRLYNGISGNQDFMTIEIDDVLHLIAMRHVLNYWVLIPCTLEKTASKSEIHFTIENKKIKKTEINEDQLIDTLVFKKGSFIIRDISILDGTKNILCRSKILLQPVKE